MKPDAAFLSTQMPGQAGKDAFALLDGRWMHGDSTEASVRELAAVCDVSALQSTFASEPFDAWFSKHEPPAGAGEQGEVVLFATCYGQYNVPSVARAAVLVLEHNGFRVARLEADEPMCCGMPNLDGGDVDGFVAKVKKNVEVLVRHVRAGRRIVVPGPTCGYTMKKEWVEYVPSLEAREVAAATLEVRPSNHPGRALYAALGFKVEGVRRDYYQHPREDALILWRRGLHPAASA